MRMSVTPKKSANNKTKPALRFSLQCAVDLPQIPQRATIRRWVIAAIEADADITVRMVESEEALRLNRDFRGGDYVPNVLSFGYSEAHSSTVHGDIAVCPQKVLEEAAVFGFTPTQRFAHMIVHGTLHLQGYDHGAPAEAARMEARETQILAALGFPDPYETQSAALTQSPQT